MQKNIFKAKTEFFFSKIRPHCVVNSKYYLTTNQERQCTTYSTVFFVFFKKKFAGHRVSRYQGLHVWCNCIELARSYYSSTKGLGHTKMFFLDWLSKNLFYYLFMPKCLLLILLWLIFLKRLNSLYYQTIKDLALKNHICTLKTFFRLKLSDVILSLNLFKKYSSIRFGKNEIKNQCFSSAFDEKKNHLLIGKTYFCYYYVQNCCKLNHNMQCRYRVYNTYNMHKE